MFKNYLKAKENRTIASNYVSLLVLQAANYILPLLVLPYLVRVLGTDKFGLIMLAQSLTTVSYTHLTLPTICSV